MTKHPARVQRQAGERARRRGLVGDHAALAEMPGSDGEGALCTPDLYELTLGAPLLGNGGGGDPALARLIAERVIDDCGPVTVAKLDELPDAAQLVTVGGWALSYLGRAASYAHTGNSQATVVKTRNAQANMCESPLQGVLL